MKQNSIVTKTDMVQIAISTCKRNNNFKELFTQWINLAQNRVAFAELLDITSTFASPWAQQSEDKLQYFASRFSSWAQLNDIDSVLDSIVYYCGYSSYESMVSILLLNSKTSWVPERLKIIRRRKNEFVVSNSGPLSATDQQLFSKFIQSLPISDGIKYST